MKALARVREYLTIADLVLEVRRLRRELAAKDMTIHDLLDNSVKYETGLNEGVSFGSACAHDVVRAARSYLNDYMLGTSLEDHARVFAELDAAVYAAEQTMFEPDDDEDEDIDEEGIL